MQNRIADQKGQGLMEYIVLSGLIGIFCLGAIKFYGETLKNRIEYMRTQVVKEFKI